MKATSVFMAKTTEIPDFWTVLNEDSESFHGQSHVQGLSNIDRNKLTEHIPEYKTMKSLPWHVFPPGRPKFENFTIVSLVGYALTAVICAHMDLFFWNNTFSISTKLLDLYYLLNSLSL